MRQKTQDVVSRVRKVENLVDCFVVADMKDMGRLKLSSIYTAAMLKQELDTEVIPVIAVRDTNRSGVRTLFLTALSYGLDSVMLVWGDSTTTATARRTSTTTRRSPRHQGDEGPR